MLFGTYPHLGHLAEVSKGKKSSLPRLQSVRKVAAVILVAPTSCNEEIVSASAQSCMILASCSTVLIPKCSSSQDRAIYNHGHWWQGLPSYLLKTIHSWFASYLSDGSQFVKAIFCSLTYLHRCVMVSLRVDDLQILYAHSFIFLCYGLSYHHLC